MGASRRPPDRDDIPLVPALPHPGTRFAGRYTLLDAGRGDGPRPRFRARDEQLGREVGLTLFDAAAPGAQDEARALARETGPGVPRVFDLGEADGWVFVVSELPPAAADPFEETRVLPTAAGAAAGPRAGRAGRPRRLPTEEPARRVRSGAAPAFLRDRRLLPVVAGLALLALLLYMLPPYLAPAPFCARGTRPSFEGELGALKSRLGSSMGDPRDCAHPNPENGDMLQNTSTGLAYLRKASGLPSFTTGTEHWALRDGRLVYWSGEAVDPPRTAAVLERGIRPP